MDNFFPCITKLYEKMKIAIFTCMILISSIAGALEKDQPPPVDLMLLAYEKVFEGESKKGPHGEKSYCYKVKERYTVYSENLLGEGYSFSKEAPDQKCLATKSQINTSNKLGLSVGISQGKASSLLGFELAEGENRMQWHYQRPIHNRPYDDLTTLDIIIKNGLVHAVSVFNTVTY